MRKLILCILSLMLIAPNGLCSLGLNLSARLEPQIIGQMNETDNLVTPEEAILWMQLRTLWQEQVFWTRMAISALIQGSEEMDPIFNRLLRNSRDMAETLRPFFGSIKADQYRDLIRDHLTIAVEVVNAAKDGNKTTLQNARQRWLDNAGRIALFENSTVSGLSLEERRTTWYDHLNLTANETVQMLNGDYNVSIETMDRIEERAIMMADSLADAIVRMNPERFHEMQSKMKK